MSLFRRGPVLASGQTAPVGGVQVRLKVDGRARRISLRLDPKAREVVATAPSAAHLPKALAFATAREAWISERLAALPVPAALRPGIVLDLCDGPCRLDRAAMRISPRLKPATEEEPARLIVHGEGEVFARGAVRGLKALALDRLTRRTEAHATALDRPMPPVAVMDARGRWGSCRQATASAPASIRYSWRLVLSPAWVLDYVAAHEVAHLEEANHSPAYWAVVARLYGDPRPARAWLRTHGAKLHAIG